MKSKKLRDIAALLSSLLVFSGLIGPKTALAANGDNDYVTGSSWTNGDITTPFYGTETDIAIGGNNGTPQVPAIEVANSQAMNGMGPGNYIFTTAKWISGNGVNTGYAQAILNSHYFKITNTTQGQTVFPIYAGSDVYEISGYHAYNPYSNPYYYGPGQYVHLTPIPKPTISISGVQDTTKGTSADNGVSPGDSIHVTYANNRSADNVTPAWGPGGILAYWYFNGTYTNAFQNNSNLNIPAYGFTPYGGTWQRGYKDTGSFDISVPTNASGQGKLFIYYVDGIDRFAEASYTVNVVTPTISISASPSSLTVGQTSQLTVKATNLQQGDQVVIAQTNTQAPGTLNGNYKSNQVSITYTMDQDYATYTFNPTAMSTNAATYAYTAQIRDSSGRALVSDGPVDITWNATIKPSISLAADTTTPAQGQHVNLTATPTNVPPGGYTVIYDESANQTHTGTTWQPPETTGTATYVAYIKDASGNTVATSNEVTVIWPAQTGPTITITANPQTLGPGQYSQITYQVSGSLPAGDYVKVIGVGGPNAWNTTGQTDLTESYSEVEFPDDGQNIQVQYVAQIYNQSTGSIVATATTSVTWINNFTGSISLSASPTVLPTGQSTTLTATVTQSLPSGYYIQIWDQTTGQLVGYSSNSTFSVQYNNWDPETDTFFAVISDGYTNIGNDSNTVQVQWTSVYATPNPAYLPVNSTSTITVKGLNLPSGYWLLLYDQTTGQVVGSGQSSTLTVTQTQTTAQTHVYVPYISTTNSIANPFATGLSVSVDWYGVTLSATPTYLPSGNATTLTATAQNVPSGYALYIVNKTTNQVVAAGAPGQTTLTATDTKSDIESDTYVAEIGVPSTSGTIYVAEKGHGIYSVHDTPQNDLSNGHQWTFLGNPNSSMLTYSLGYDPNTKTLYAGEVSVQPNGYASPPYLDITGGQVYYQTTGTNTWKPINLPGIASFMIYDQVSKKFFVAMRDTSGNNGLYVADPNTPGQFSLITSTKQKTPKYMFAVDPNTGYLYAANGVDDTTGATPAGDIRVFDSNGNYLKDYPLPISGDNQTNIYYDPQKHVFITCDSVPNTNGYVAYLDPSTGTITTYDNTYGGPMLFSPGGGLGQDQATNGNTTVYVDFSGLTYEQNGTYRMTNFTLWNPSWMSNCPPLNTGVVPYGTGFLVAMGARNPQLLGTRNNNDFTEGLYLWDPNIPNRGTEIPDPYSNTLAAGDFPAIIRVDTVSPPTNITATSLPVQVTWYKYQLSLTASPTVLGTGEPTTLTAVSPTGGPTGDVIEIYDQTTGQVVGESTPNATSFSANWTESSPTTDTFIAYFLNPSTNAQDQPSNTVDVQWTQVKLTLSNALVTHTPHWLSNIQAWNTKNPNNTRDLSLFWAGEELVFQVQPSTTNIASAYVSVDGLTYDPYVPSGAPASLTVPLTVDPTTGLLTGHTDPSLSTYFQYLLNGSYTVTFTVKGTDNQIASTRAVFTIDGKWTDYWRNTQVY